MYGYRTKHAILETYIFWLHSREKNSSKEMPYGLLLENTYKRMGIINRNLKYIASTLIYLEFEDYFISPKAEKGDKKLLITEKGISAQAGDIFLIKQRETMWKAIMNISITLANIIVAITATWAIIRGNGELQKLKERLDILELKSQPSKGLPSPKILPLKICLPATKDSGKTK